MTTNTSTRHPLSNLSNDTPLSIDQIASQARDLTDNRLVCVGGGLYYIDALEIRSLTSAPALFAWLDQYVQVTWTRGGVTKEEFFCGLPQRLPNYAWATPYPHFPALPNVLYLGQAPASRRTNALDEFIARFRPATEADRAVLEAMVLTLFWAGPPGQRPQFVLTGRAGDERMGCGVGKTTCAEMIARLVGGAVAVRPNQSVDRRMSGLLSPSTLPLRVALVDNLKTDRFSNADLEALVTSVEIDGHQLYVGRASRPNYLTWIVTVNYNGLEDTRKCLRSIAAMPGLAVTTLSRWPRRRPEMITWLSCL